ncbi:hypothetical protein ASD62_07210 [Phycicoccus sp. Root563]|uniref:S1C family serine protease n=1 Tax=Phycicoccus sp. Root563 TaxID=1736562 RepID=UPI000702AD63|nr:trypsin-like peptidase domain-containing protein [Phycicoccus sp. Root563]KQZ89124.1 hypothetical protein ASD62_07210 [Phycicoccus sp. Root563]
MSDERPPSSDQPGHEAGQHEGHGQTPETGAVATPDPTPEPADTPEPAPEPVWSEATPAHPGRPVPDGAGVHEPASPRDVTPVEPAWDPWAPPRDDQPVAQPQQGYGAGSAPDHTQPVDLSHTQELSGSTASAGDPVQTPAQTPAQAPAREQAWASEPTGWPSQADREHGPGDASAGAGAPALGAATLGAAGAPAPSAQGSGWDPISATSADAGYGGHQGHWVGGQPLAPSAPHQKGPGWGALVGVAAVAALVAATLGGMFGGWLGATDRLGFGNLDRTGTSIPTVGAGATARPEGSIANIAAKALPSVVTIKVKGADGAGTGSGFVLDRDGHIITNNHVVASAAAGGTIAVELSNGTEIEATILGRDSSYDLAVLKTSRTDLVPLVIGASKDVVVGDQVIAVGAPLGLESSVTSGIVSALNRPVSPGGDGDQQSFINAIQTDAAINPGNSGGPLLDMQGHVIGINSAIARIPGAADVQSGNIGVGFSIPSDQVAKTAAQLIKTGKAEHPVIGVILDRQYTGSGVKILASGSGASANPVTPDGPAGKAGIKPGDVIVEFDGRPVSDPDDLVVAIRAKSVGDKVPMKVRRGSETISVTVTLTGTSGS